MNDNLTAQDAIPVLIEVRERTMRVPGIPKKRRRGKMPERRSKNNELIGRRCTVRMLIEVVSCYIHIKFIQILYPAAKNNTNSLYSVTKPGSKKCLRDGTV